MSQGLKPRDTEMAQGNSVEGPGRGGAWLPTAGVVAGGVSGVWAVLSWALLPVSRDEWALEQLCCVSWDTFTRLCAGPICEAWWAVEPPLPVVASASVGPEHCWCSGHCQKVGDPYPPWSRVWEPRGMAPASFSSRGSSEFQGISLK